MIAGVVNDALEATIRLTVRGPSRQEESVEAVMDTGFDGYLTLPPAVIAALELPWRRKARGALLAISIRIWRRVLPSLWSTA